MENLRRYTRIEVVRDTFCERIGPISRRREIVTLLLYKGTLCHTNISPMNSVDNESLMQVFTLTPMNWFRPFFFLNLFISKISLLL